MNNFFPFLPEQNVTPPATTARSGFFGDVSDDQYAQGIGLLQAAAALADAGAPSAVPQSLGGALAKGLSQGVNAYQQAQDQTVDRKLKQTQIERDQAAYDLQQSRTNKWTAMFQPQTTQVADATGNIGFQELARSAPIYELYPHLSDAEVGTLQFLGPDAGISFLQNMSKPIALGPDEALYDPSTREMIAKNAKPIKPTYKDFKVGDTIEQRVSYDNGVSWEVLSTAPRFSPSQSSPVATANDIALTEIGQGRYEKLIGQREAARQTRTNILQLSQLMESAPTGKLEDFALPLKQWAEGFGINLGVSSETSAQEAFNALSNQLALQLRNPDSGAGMPGSMSDKDREFLKASVVGLEKTTVGNQLLLTMGLSVADYNIKMGEEASRYTANGGNLAQLDNHMNEWVNNNPLFNEELKREITTTLEGTRGLPVVSSLDEARQLPVGTKFIDPNGDVRVR